MNKIEQQIAWLNDPHADGIDLWSWGQGKPHEACATTMQELYEASQTLGMIAVAYPETNAGKMAKKALDNLRKVNDG